jgi:hypothetical protein
VRLLRSCLLIPERYYNNLNKFEELKSFKRFYAEDPIPGVDVVVEKIPPGNSYVVGINGGTTLKEDIEEAYGVTINTECNCSFLCYG